MSCFSDVQSVTCGQGQEDVPLGDYMTALRAPGRPKDLEKRGAILDAAQALFAERGIDGAAIEAIAARSGVSKVTVYGHFRDKPAILEALIARETERVSESILAATQGDGALRESLIRVGETLVRIGTTPCHMALDRIIALETQRNPEIGRRFFEQGPYRVHVFIAGLIAAAQEKGEIGPGDPQIMAQDLISLWFGFHAIKRKFCGGCTPPTDELQGAVTHAVTLFLKAYAPATP